MTRKFIVFFFVLATCISSATPIACRNTSSPPPRAAAAGESADLLQQNLGIVGHCICSFLHNDKVVIYDRTDFDFPTFLSPTGNAVTIERKVLRLDCTLIREYDVASKLCAHRYGSIQMFLGLLRRRHAGPAFWNSLHFPRIIGRFCRIILRISVVSGLSGMRTASRGVIRARGRRFLLPVEKFAVSGDLGGGFGLRRRFREVRPDCESPELPPPRFCLRDAGFSSREQRHELYNFTNVLVPDELRLEAFLAGIGSGQCLSPARVNHLARFNIPNSRYGKRVPFSFQGAGPVNTNLVTVALVAPSLTHIILMNQRLLVIGVPGV
nr:aldehyde oxidase GLOX-like [Ipomoea batatas]